MDKYNWASPVTLPDEHRIFHGSLNPFTNDKAVVEQSKGVAIADNSGYWPDETDDGVLWLDMDWNLIISSPDKVLCVPVKNDAGERFSTVTDMSSLLYLSAEFNWPIEDQITGQTYTITKE
jgi:hypothetical protein